jgi:hypothetical protein
VSAVWDGFSVAKMKTKYVCLSDSNRESAQGWLRGIFLNAGIGGGHSFVMLTLLAGTGFPTRFWCEKSPSGACEAPAHDNTPIEHLRAFVRNVTTRPRSAYNVVDSSTIKGKVLAGYQGWDGARSTWDHWSNDGRPPGADAKNEHFEMVPQMGEYPPGSTMDTQFKYNGNGSAVPLYTNAADGVVDLHFKWMADYGMDGVLLQRFISECAKPGKGLDQRNQILAQADAAAAKHGRTYAMMWDMSGASSAWDDEIKSASSESRTRSIPAC